MPEKDLFVWLCLQFSGRVSRAAYLLASLLVAILPTFFLYQMLRVPQGSPASQIWALGFLVAFIFSLWAHVALSVKRLHDVDRPGVIAAALFVPVVSIVAFVALCVVAGNPGPNRYGHRTNAPAGG